MRRTAPALALALPLTLLAGCADPGGSSKVPAEPADPPVADSCGAGKVGRYLNALPTAEVMAAITAAAAGEGNIRKIQPGDAVTMDFREERLNVEIGEDGRIKRLRCG